ncbi:MAG TPA: hypothetical protein VHB30_04625 [Solirubrobacteraceae bacterium]|nr:hypothetical protein [Solirubrobacteraceae bacterium]
MSEAERPDRAERASSAVTLEDIRQLTGAATPHFALQIRNRIAKLVADLPADDEARLAGERAMAELVRLGRLGEARGVGTDEALRPLPSLDPVAAADAFAAGAPDH